MKIYNTTFKQINPLRKTNQSKNITTPEDLSAASRIKDKTTLDSRYYLDAFKANQKLSKTSFKGCMPEANIQQLKNALNVICLETIDKYNNYDRSVSRNLFTRGFIQHCFDFSAKEGYDLHNVKDPFFDTQWSYYFYNKQKTTVSGASLCSVFSKKMESGIQSWTEKFLQTILKEKADGHNNLFDELLENREDIQKIKNALCIS